MPGSAVHSHLLRLLSLSKPVWLVGGTASERKVLLQSFAHENRGTYLRLGATFSEGYAQADAFAQKRPDTLLLQNFSRHPAPLCLDEADILFDAYLKWDPRRALAQLAQTHPCLVSWPGTADDSTLHYPDASVPGVAFPRSSLLTYSLD